jgi:transglutaminase-like putative cysteine protease
MTPSDRTTLACALAALSAGLPLMLLTVDRTYLVLAAMMIAVSAGIGIGSRHLGAPGWVARLLQLAAVMILPIMVPSVRNPIRLISKTITHLQASVAPMPYEVGFAALSGLLLWALFLVLEAIGERLRTSALGLVLVLPGFAAATLVVPDAVTFWHFALPAGAFAVLLATATRNRAGQESPGASVIGLRRGILSIAALSTALALAAAAAIAPRLPAAHQDWGLGSTGGVQLVDPSLDLIRNINATSDRPVLSYRSDDGAGTYLRLAALSGFTENGFGLVPTELFPAPMPGAKPVGEQRWVKVSVTVDNFASQWLPVPWVPTSYSAPGDWRYDRTTLAVAAVGDTQDEGSRRLRYTATGWQPITLEQELAGAAVGNPGDRGLTLELPDGISPEVTRLVNELTSGLGSAGAKALALRDYLRSGEFEYSTQIVPGTTIGTLNDFLVGSRVGYCEQFAGGLATMARIAGIPSRVVVGFLPGRKNGDVWQVSVRNMHAWTELYFDDLGWVALDATPPGAVQGGPAPSASAEPSIAPTSSASHSQSPAPLPSQAPRPATAGNSTVPVLPILGWLAAGLVLLALPRLARIGLRHLRLRRRDPIAAAEGAWAEAKAQLADAGIRLEPGSPRRQASAAAAQLDQSAAAALAGLAIAVERARYDREPVARESLQPLLAILTAALTGRRSTLTAQWWPRSLRVRAHASQADTTAKDRRN